MNKKDDISAWYLADVVERSEAVGAKKSNPNRRCLTWVNTLLIRAHGSEIAWTDRGYSSAKRSEGMVLSKRALLKDASRSFEPTRAKPRAAQR